MSGFVGAKGITAECALAFARAAHVQLALVGSSLPAKYNEQHDEIFRTLRRFKKAGLSAQYYQCDVTDIDAVNKLVRQVESEQGEITGVIHGCALNRPGELNSVSADHALEEIGPKIIGALNLCAALKDTPLKLFLAFTSITGISGMIQNGWYGFSNEALQLILRKYGESVPGTAVLSIAFSIWDEVGMGVKMGSTAWLSKMGVEALSVQQGTARFLRLITHDPGADEVIVTARTSELDTFASPAVSVPKGLQFLENVIEYYPGVELVCRASLSLESDAYIKDHCWRGTYLFPMVFGLEAMAQAVQAVTGNTSFDAVCIEDIQLMRPITLSEHGKTEIELHAQVVEPENQQDASAVQVQIRSEQTDFSVDHFSATFVLAPDPAPVQEKLPEQRVSLGISPSFDLYNGRLLFQGTKFQRIHQVFHLTSDTCLFKAIAYPEGAEVR
ncbi:MAG: SDR family oxidoreductase [Candidatus Electrothrix sp. ATG1]|nr:SDR family oxidoreductase [Candidatus Electrothrix sp. ATG1]